MVSSVRRHSSSLVQKAKAATDKLVSRGFSRKNTDENRANCAKNKFNDCLFSMAWEKIVLKQLIPNIVTAIHFSRKELYLQLVAHPPISWRCRRFKDRLEDGRGLTRTARPQQFSRL